MVFSAAEPPPFPPIQKGLVAADLKGPCPVRNQFVAARSYAEARNPKLLSCPYQLVPGSLTARNQLAAGSYPARSQFLHPAALHALHLGG